MIGPLWIWAVVCARAGMPSTDVEVAVEIVGSDARIAVHQRFRNDGDEPVEAVYSFAPRAADRIDGIALRVGDRDLPSSRRNRLDGQVALGTLDPGQTAEITLRLTRALPLMGGAYSFELPLSELPRLVPAAGEPPPLAPRPDQTAQLDFDLHGGPALLDFSCPTEGMNPLETGPSHRQLHGELPLDTVFQASWSFDDTDVVYTSGTGASGTAEEIVVETGRAVNVDSTTEAHVLSNAMLTKLPTRRTYQSALALAPGVIPGSNPRMGSGSSNENVYMVDGTNVSDGVTGTFTANFNYDAIEQIEVVLGGYMPEYGSSLGGAVNLVTATGNNNLQFSAAAYYTNGNWGPRMDERITPDGLSLAPTGFDSQFQMLQITGQVSGPLIRDKAWVLLSTQHDRSILANTGIPQTRDYDGHYLLTKLTVQPSVAHRLTAMAQMDPTTVDNLDQGDAYQKAEAQGRQVQGGILLQGRWQWFLGDRANLETTVSTQKSFIEINSVPCTHDPASASHPCEPGEAEGHVDWETPGRIGLGGAYDSVNFLNFAFDDRWRTAVSTKLALGKIEDPLDGTHDLKAGVELSWLSWNQLNGINGNLYFVDTNAVPYDPTTLQNYYWVESTGPVRFRESGNQASAFVQDSYKPARTLTINYGSRVDQFTMRDDRGQPVLQGLLLGPRLYGSWDATGDQRTKVATGYGRFNDTGRLGVADFASAARSGSHLYLGDAFGTGSGLGVLNNAENDYDTDAARNPTTLAPNLRNPRVDELILQVEREVVEDFAIAAHLTGRFVRNGYEYDDTNLIFDSDGSAVIGARTSDFTQSTPRLRTPALAKRDYFRWDLVAHKIASHNWEVQGTYSYTISGGSSPTALSGAFANDAQTQYNVGPFTSDLRHMVKTWAWWDLPTDPWTTTLGATFDAYSGAPEERLYLAENQADGLSSQSLRIRPRGTYLRLNPWWTAGIRLQQTIDVRRGDLTVDLSVTNLTNNRAPTTPDFGTLDSANRLLTTRRQDGPTATAGVRYSF